MPERRAERKPNVALMMAAGVAGVLVIALVNFLFERLWAGLWVALSGSIVMVLVVLLWRWARSRREENTRLTIGSSAGEPEVVSTDPVPLWVQMLLGAVTPIVVAPLVGLALGALWLGVLVAVLCTASATIMFTIVMIRDYKRHGDLDPGRW